jgi:hypothetical protein
MSSKYLPIYLNDHLAAATAEVELVGRVAKQYDDEVGELARRLQPELRAERDTLRDVMDTLGASADRAKVAFSWVGEKAGRLKLNGELRDSSPLSPVVELEGLTVAIETRRMLWATLYEVDELAERLGRDRLQELIARAERQREEVEVHRREAARRALA